jgi:hypothetical protein
LGLSDTQIAQAVDKAAEPPPPRKASNVEVEAGEAREDSTETTFSQQYPEAKKEGLIWVSGFEEGKFQFKNGGRPEDNAGPCWPQAQFQGPYAAEFVPSPVRSGEKALRLEWRKSELKKNDNTSTKAMMHFGKPPSADGTERWYGFSVYLPSQDTPDESGVDSPHYWLLLFQAHATPDRDLGEPWRQPPLSIGLRKGALVCGFSYDLEKVSPKNVNIEAHRQTRELGKQAEFLDRWTDFVVHARFSLQGKGLLQVWVDGRLIVDEQDITLGYNDALGPYPSWGIYSYNSIAERRVLFLDEIRVGGPAVGYEGVAPGRGDGSMKPSREASRLP